MSVVSETLVKAKALIEYQRFCDAMLAVREAIGGADPVRYNDTVGRTKEQVLAALDRAIARSA